MIFIGSLGSFVSSLGSFVSSLDSFCESFVIVLISVFCSVGSLYWVSKSNERQDWIVDLLLVTLLSIFLVRFRRLNNQILLGMLSKEAIAIVKAIFVRFCNLVIFFFKSSSELRRLL